MAESLGGAGRSVTVPADEVGLKGDLVVPAGASAIVVFAHGTGSGRHSPRNRQVAAHLAEGGLATLLLDLLTEEEEIRDADTAEFRFDVDRLAGRVVAAVDWAASEPSTASLTPGCFGASTGAAAALVAAAARPQHVRAVVSRGGRPDLAHGILRSVTVPTLLIVGGKDTSVLELNEAALSDLPGETRLEIVPGASHLFEEPGALEEVARHASDWFRRHLGGATTG